MSIQDDRKDAEGQTEAPHQHDEVEPSGPQRVFALPACRCRFPLGILNFSISRRNVSQDPKKPYFFNILEGKLGHVRLVFDFEENDLDRAQDAIKAIMGLATQLAAWDHSIGHLQGRPGAEKACQKLEENRDMLANQLTPYLERFAHSLLPPREVEVWWDNATGYRVVIGRAHQTPMDQPIHDTLWLNKGKYDPKDIVAQSYQTERLDETADPDTEHSFVRMLTYEKKREIIFLGVASAAHRTNGSLSLMESAQDGSFLGMYNITLELGRYATAKVVTTTPAGDVLLPTFVELAPVELAELVERRQKEKEEGRKLQVKPIPTVERSKVVHQIGDGKLGNRLELPSGDKTDQRRKQKCDACRKKFLPREPFHKLCDACAKKRNDQPIQPTADQPTAPLVMTLEKVEPPQAEPVTGEVGANA